MPTKIETTVYSAVLIQETCIIYHLATVILHSYLILLATSVLIVQDNVLLVEIYLATVCSVLRLQKTLIIFQLA